MQPFTDFEPTNAPPANEPADRAREQGEATRERATPARPRYARFDDLFD